MEPQPKEVKKRRKLIKGKFLRSCDLAALLRLHFLATLLRRYGLINKNSGGHTDAYIFLFSFYIK